MISVGRRARLALPLVAAMLLSSCSFISDFVVVNESGAPLEVQYAYKERFAAPKCCAMGELPQRRPARDLGNDERPWTTLREGEYFYNATAASVTVVLRPGEALLVTRLNGYAGPGTGQEESFTVRSVRLAGASGTIFFEGLQAQAAFKEEERQSLYAIRYR
ncbi:MAG TPA: hypothetical protein VEQ42_07265 [Pyrinomonadaceae bacterium]|nr:hypothetical protein [Pyrinomonadaceae bacterium]